MARTVRAAVMTSPGKVEIQGFPYPSLEDGAMLVKVEMSGICGTDKHTYQGENVQYPGTPAEISTPFPIIPGHENVGLVAEITPQARRGLEFDGEELKEGDRVVMCPDVFCGKCFYCRYVAGYKWCDNVRSYGNSFSCANPPHLFGGWAEYIYIRPDCSIYKVPEDISPRVAVLAELFACTYSLDKAKEFYSLSGEGFASGDTVVIQGVGPLGFMHLIKARILGAGDIIAIDISDHRLGLAKAFGADYVINARNTTSQERIDRVRDLTKGRGADVVVECAGVSEVIVEGLEMTRRGGMYLEVGCFVQVDDVTINPSRHLNAKNIRLIGVSNHPVTGYRASLKLMQKYKGMFPLEKIVTHEYKLDNSEEALKKSMQPDCMKVVITP